METAELQGRLRAKEAECLLLQQQASAAQIAASSILEANRQELARVQEEVHRLEQEKLTILKQAVWETGAAPMVVLDDSATEKLRQENKELQRKLEELQEGKDTALELLRSQLDGVKMQWTANQNADRPAVKHVAGKDKKMDDLQLAIRDLETKLAVALQHNSDMMSKDAFQESLPATSLSGTAPQEYSQLYLKLTATQRQLIRARSTVRKRDDTLVGMQSLLEEQEELTEKARRELENERQLRLLIERTTSAPSEASEASTDNSKALQAYNGHRPLAAIVGEASNPQLETWQQQKKLQKQIEGLRLKLQEKTHALQEQNRQQSRTQTHIATLQNKLEGQSRLVSHFQDQLRSSADVPPVFFSSEQVQTLTERLVSLEEDNSRLKMQIQQADSSSSKQPSVQTAIPGQTLEDKSVGVLDLVRERDEALALAAKVKQRIVDLFGPEAGQLDALMVTAKSVGKGKVGNAAARREAQLTATAAALQRILERKEQESGSAVSSSKHAQVVEKKKELQRQLADAEAVVKSQAGLKGEVQHLERRCQHLQRMNDGMQRDVKKLEAKLQKAEGAVQRQDAIKQQQQQQVGKDLQVLPAADSGLPAQAQNSQIPDIQKPDASSEAASVVQSERQNSTEAAAPTSSFGGQHAANGSSVEVTVLRSQLEVAVTENLALRDELSAIDPEFFEELEDMKHDNHILKQQLAELKAQHTDLQRQLAPAVL